MMFLGSNFLDEHFFEAELQDREYVAFKLLIFKQFV